jgi:hypothetical protein
LPHWLFVSPGWQTPVSSQHPPQFCGPHPPPSPGEQNPVLQLRPCPQIEHACPPEPHSVVVLPVTQVLPSQHPEQSCGLHEPLSKICWQKPPGQTLFGGQMLHCWPPNPHPVTELPPTQTLFSQQPPQLLGPQGPASNCIWQKPPWQVVPGGQSRQALPPAPHAVGAPPPRQTGMGEPPVIPQQPLQLDGPQGGTAHVPPVQTSLAGQVAHAPPPTPHPPTLVPVSHVLPLQQPLQLPGPHAVTCFSQTLDWQVKVAGHAAQLSPFCPHSALVVPPWQMPFGSQHPSQFCGPHWLACRH